MSMFKAKRNMYGKTERACGRYSIASYSNARGFSTETVNVAQIGKAGGVKTRYYNKCCRPAPLSL